MLRMAEVLTPILQEVNTLVTELVVTAHSFLQDLQGQGNFGLAVSRREGKQLSPTGEMSKYGTVKSSFNRQAPFLDWDVYLGITDRTEMWT